MTSSLRPDELAATSQIERERNIGGSIKKGIKTAIGLGTAGVGLGISSKILPFINEHISSDLAVKGISKISPKLGDFLKKGMSQGLDVKDGLNFIKEQFKPETTKEDRNIIQQYSPELFQFIDSEVKKGRSAIEAGAIAQNDKRFSDVIKKLSKDHKTPWSNILQSVFGGPEMEEPNKQMAQQSKAALQDQTQQQMQGQQQGQGQGDQALLAAMQKILSM